MKRGFALLLICLLPIALMQCGGKKDDKTVDTKKTEAQSHDHDHDHDHDMHGHEGHDHDTDHASKEKMVDQPVVKTKKFSLKTSMGDIVLELDYGKAPITCENFESYASKGHYNGTIFHRVIDGFMIQGGGFTPDMQQKDTDAPIENEAFNGLKNAVGTIAMARTNAVHSATSQFFINVKDNDFLNHRNAQDPRAFGYCVFGKVVDGMDVVNQIKAVQTGMKDQFQDVPVETITINSISLID